MKVLIIYHYIAHYRLPIFKELKSSKGIKFDFAAGLITDNKIKIVNNNEISFFKLKNFWLFKNKLLWQSDLIKLIFKDYDHFIFLGNPYFISTWVCLFLCFFKNKKASIWTHGVTKDLTFFKKFVLKIMWKFSDKIFVYGNYAKKKLIEYGVDINKVIVVYNSLDYKQQLLVRKSLIRTTNYFDLFQNDYPTFLFTGRLTKVKRLDLVLDAILNLRDKSIFCNFILIGEGEEMEYLKRLVKEYRLNKNVLFYGPCYNENVLGSFFYNSIACISPGNVGLTAMHSLVYGTPVITHSNFQNQMPEFEAIQDGITGSFFEYDSVVDLSNKMKFWIDHSHEELSNKRKICYEVIDNKYNPSVQLKIFTESLAL